MKNKGIVIFFVIVVACILGIILFNNNFGIFTLNSSNQITVGVVATITGPGAYLGDQEVKGLQLALDKLNFESNKKIVLDIQDSKASPEEAVKIIEYFKNKNIKYVIGDSWTATTKVMAPLTNKYNMILISPDSTSDDQCQDDLFFRTIPNTNDMMIKLANYAYYDLNSRFVATIYSDTSFGLEHASDFKTNFEKLGGKVILEEKISFDQIDFKTELTKIKNKSPDTVFSVPISGAQIGEVSKQAKELGINTKWIGSFGIETESVIKEYKDYTSGIVYPFPFDSDLNNFEIQSFISEFKNKYNELPDITAVNAYDALMLLYNGIKEHENVYSIKDYLLKINKYNGASGIISFNYCGDVNKPIIIKQIQNGKFVKISN